MIESNINVALCYFSDSFLVYELILLSFLLLLEAQGSYGGGYVNGPSYGVGNSALFCVILLFF